MATTVFSTYAIELKGGRIVHDGGALAIGAEPVIIGRDPACQLALSASGVSAMHAELVATPRGVRLRDLGSKNGTWASDIRVVEAYLTEPTTFFVARTEIQFEPTKAQKVDLPEVDHFGPLY